MAAPSDLIFFDIRDLSTTAHRRLSPPPERGAPDRARLHDMLVQLEAGDAFQISSAPKPVSLHCFKLQCDTDSW